MATRKIEISQDIYQLKVTLLGTKPPIWRRLLVPSTLSLAQLHDVLQIAMGWENEHMHEFRMGSQYFGEPDNEDQFMGIAPVKSGRTASLSTVLNRVSAKMIYTYDMGDSWEHNIVLEKRLPLDPAAKYPVCLGGKLACPPEDCGGIPGYYHLLEAIEDPNHAEHDELCEWLGGDYDPQAFSVDEINKHLSSARRRSKICKR
jgi:hypothetical protein